MAATTTDSRDFDVQQLTDTVQGVFAGKNAFMGSIIASQGGVVVRDNMREGDPSYIGNEITMPYFGTIGDFSANPEDTAVVPKALRMTNEKAQVERSSLAFEATHWSRHSGPDDADPYEECARQILEAANRRMDELAVTKAATTPLVVDKHSASSPQYLDWDTIVDGRALWGDRQDDIVAMAIHSRVEADLRKLKDNNGNPLLVDKGMQGSTLTRFCGVPLVISDRVPLTGSTMGSVTSAGTSPPVITLSGTPLGPWNLAIKVIATGALGAWTLQFSTDGGNTWSATLTSAASVPLIDTATDSLVGMNGATGITASIAAGSASANNTWSATASLKATSLIIQKAAVAFWYNRRALSLASDKDILKHNDVAAMHMYHATHLYRRRPGSVKPGVVAIRHNVRGYNG